jgi:hypothetical protein
MYVSFQRNASADRSTGAGARLDGNLTAHQLHSLSHADEPEAATVATTVPQEKPPPCRKMRDQGGAPGWLSTLDGGVSRLQHELHVALAIQT